MNLRKELDEKITGYLDVIPETTYYPTYDPAGKKNIYALTYEGAMIGSKKTKVFAYLGYPEGQHVVKPEKKKRFCLDLPEPDILICMLMRNSMMVKWKTIH